MAETAEANVESSRSPSSAFATAVGESTTDDCYHDGRRIEINDDGNRRPTMSSVAPPPTTPANEAKTTTYDDDGFLLSMTFASAGRDGGGGGILGCDCSDCGDGYDPLPRTVRDAVNWHNERKRLAVAGERKRSRRPHRTSSSSSSSFASSWESWTKKSTMTRTIRQDRSLVRREGEFSLWRLDMPLELQTRNNHGDPIVEQRNSHRILYVMRLDEGSSTVLSIGKGIIGSAMEGGSRKRMDWIEGSSYLLPRSEGIACGWIHVPRAGWRERDRDDDADGDTEGGRRVAAAVDHDDDDDDDDARGSRAVDDVVLYSLKVSVEALRRMEDEACEEHDRALGGESTWISKSRELFLGILEGGTEPRIRRRRRRLLLQMKPRDDDARGDDDDNDDDDNEINIPPEGIVLSNDETLMMKNIIDLAL